MANVYAVKTGNWSDTTVWNTGALPTSADNVYSNNYTVTIDINPTILSVRNVSDTGIAAGGYFILTNNITLTCTSNRGTYVHNTACIQSNLTLGQSANVIANLYGSEYASNGVGLIHQGNGTINIIGNCTGSSYGGGPCYGAYNTSDGSVNITGNCFGNGNQNAGAVNGGGGTMTITGNCTSLNVDNNGGAGAWNASSGQMNIIGSCIGGSRLSSGDVGVLGTGGIIRITGVIQSNGYSAGASWGPQGWADPAFQVTGPMITNSLGINPLQSKRWYWISNSITPTRYEVYKADLSAKRNLYTADSVGGNPATSNVRSGTVYGPNSELTGTCAVPAAGSVALGVPVDATTGTAVLTASAIRTAVGLASANLDTQFKKLNNNTIASGLLG